MLKTIRIKIYVFEALQVILFILPNFFSKNLFYQSQNFTSHKTV